MTTDVLPRPRAVDGVVFNDIGTRTLTVRLSDNAPGFDQLQWRQAWQALRRAAEQGWSSGVPDVWASTPTASRVVYGVPVDGGALSFTFPVGVTAYSELVGKPRLVGIVTIDQNRHHFLTVKFLHRPGV